MILAEKYETFSAHESFLECSAFAFTFTFTFAFAFPFAIHYSIPAHPFGYHLHREDAIAATFQSASLLLGHSTRGL